MTSFLQASFRSGIVCEHDTSEKTDIHFRGSCSLTIEPVIELSKDALPVLLKVR